jgi:16S rRNA (uracil1498-N3)-methyltransferase
LTPSPDVRHHLRRVLRKRSGDELVACDGLGRRVACTWTGQVLEPHGPVQIVRRDRPYVEMAAGLLKGARWEWLLEKCVEAGVDRVVPLILAHNVAKVPARVHDRLARWQGIADAATEQCGRCWRGEVAAPMSLGEWLEARAGLLLTCDERVQEPTIGVQYVRSGRPDRVAVIVGPEGGLADDERHSLQCAGAMSVALTPWVLRSETAAVAATLAIRQAGKSI